jgi:NADH-quinone oxidoreductase subunit E
VINREEEIQTMLTPEERQEINAEFARYPTRQAVCIEALKVVQRHRGWVSDEGLKDIGNALDMTPEELDAVATFYNLVFRRPVGRHVALICDSVSCWIMGYEKLRQGLTSRLNVSLGETTADNRFTVLPIVCLGVCDHAPAMMIDDDLYRDVEPPQLDELLEKYK